MEIVIKSSDSASAGKALVVDDHEDSAAAVAIFLRDLGYEVRIATDGIDALRQANRFHPHLVLMDLGMPKLDGFDACGVLRAQPWAAGLCLLAVTGFPEDVVRSRAKESGFDGYLLKPFDPVALKECVHSVRSSQESLHE